MPAIALVSGEISKSRPQPGAHFETSKSFMYIPGAFQTAPSVLYLWPRYLLCWLLRMGTQFPIALALPELSLTGFRGQMLSGIAFPV